MSEPSGTHGSPSSPFTRLLVALLLLVFVHLVMVEAGWARFYRLVFGALLAFSAWAVSDRRPAVLRASLALGAATVATNVLAYAAPGRATALLAAATGLALLTFVAAVVLVGVLGGGRVDRDRIAGAVAAYLLLGVAWALVYTILEMVSPGAFSLPQAAEHAPFSDGSVFYYFSFVTLTTLGYGDVVPVSLPARTFTWLEAVTGQLYLAILVARLVGLHITSSRSER